MNTLQEAIDARDKYLEANPNLQSYQDEIDRILDATDPKQRMDVLAIMMSGKLMEQKFEFEKLSSILAQCTDNG